MKDILAPFDDNFTRVEDIIIQFENCLYAYNYAIIEYLLDNNYEQWANLLPGLKDYKDAPREAVFAASFLYKSEDLISKLSQGTLTYSEGLEILKLLDDLLPYDDTKYITNLGIGLSRIMDSDKIQKVRIYSNHFSEAKLDLIGTIFEGDENKNKAVGYDGNGIEECIRDNWNEVTTVFMEDVEVFYDHFVHKDEYSVKEKVFFFPSVPFNTLPVGDYIISDSSLFPFAPLKYRDLFNQLELKEKCQINIFPMTI